MIQLHLKWLRVYRRILKLFSLQKEIKAVKYLRDPELNLHVHCKVILFQLKKAMPYNLMDFTIARCVPQIFCLLVRVSNIIRHAKVWKSVTMESKINWKHIKVRLMKGKAILYKPLLVLKGIILQVPSVLSVW